LYSDDLQEENVLEFMISGLPAEKPAQVALIAHGFRIIDQVPSVKTGRVLDLGEPCAWMKSERQP
jgi:hypothetical protein